MKNDYFYIDTDNIYTDPKTGALRNLGNITDHDALVFSETAATTRRNHAIGTGFFKMI